MKAHAASQRLPRPCGRRQLGSHFFALLSWISLAELPEQRKQQALLACMSLPSPSLSIHE